MPNNNEEDIITEIFKDKEDNQLYLNQVAAKNINNFEPYSAMTSF